MIGPPRVAFVAGTLALGGAERQAVLMAHALAGRGVEVCCFALRAGEHFEDALTGHGIPVVHVPRAGALPGRILALRRAVQAWHPDVVQSTLFYTNLHAVLAARGSGALVVGAIRNDFVTELAANAPWAWGLYHLPDVLVANSRAAVDAILRHGWDTARVEHVTNVLDLAGGPMPDAPRPDGGAVRAILVARLVPDKRVDRFLRVLAAARRQEPRLQGCVVGDGPERERLEAEARRLGLPGEACTFLGTRTDVPALLAGADVAVLTSDHEGVPNVVLEAMAAGLPVVATRAGDTGDLIAHGHTGWLHDPGDEEGLAGALVRLARDGGERAAMGSAARRRVAERHAPEGLAARLGEVYARAAARTGRGRAFLPPG